MQSAALANPEKVTSRSGTFRKIGDAQHRQVVERVEIVLGDAALAAGLIEIHLRVRKPDLGDHAAEIRIGVFHGFDDFHHAAVIEPASGAVLECLDGGYPVDQPVVPLTKPDPRQARSRRRR